MKYFDTKKDSLEEAISKAINEDNKPSAKELVDEGGKYLKYSDLLLQKGRLMAKNQSTAMIDKEISKEMKKLGIKEATGDKEKYEKFFKAALKKFGVDSPADFKDDAKKKEFFNYVDKNYKGDHEESVDLEEVNAKVIMDKDQGNRDLQKLLKKHKLKMKTLQPNVNPGYDEVEISGDKRDMEKMMKTTGDDSMYKFNPRTKEFELDESKKLEEVNAFYVTDKDISNRDFQKFIKKYKLKFKETGEYNQGYAEVKISGDKRDMEKMMKVTGEIDDYKFNPRTKEFELDESKKLESKTAKDVDETLDKIREANIQKGKSMRSILADIWKMNEGKSPFEKEEDVDLEETDIKMKDQQFDGDKEQKDFFKFMKSKFKLSLKGKVEPGNTGGHTGAGDNFTLSGSDTNIIKYLRYLDDGGTTYLQIYKKKGNVYTAIESVDLESKTATGQKPTKVEIEPEVK